MSFPRLSTRRLAAPLIRPALFAALFTVLAPAHATLSKSAAPSSNFDLSHWKLTLPSGSEVGTSQLLSGYQYAGAFYTDPHNGGMVFRCPNIAGTTVNSHYSRSELREMLSPTSDTKSDANNWRPEDGGTQVARLRVDRVSTTGDSTKVGRVVIGQIHGPETEVIRLYYTKLPGEAKGRIYAGMDDTNNNNTYSPDIVSNKNGGGIALGQPFTYTIKLKGTRLFVRIRTSADTYYDYVKYVDSRYLGQNVYFKAGVYNQNNTGSSSDYVQATFFRLTHTHP
jgi:hypothetical protein